MSCPDDILQEGKKAKTPKLPYNIMDRSVIFAPVHVCPPPPPPPPPSLALIMGTSKLLRNLLREVVPERTFCQQKRGATPAADHWTAAVLYPREQRIVYLDPMGGKDEKVVVRIIQQRSHHFRALPSPTPPPRPPTCSRPTLSPYPGLHHRQAQLKPAATPPKSQPGPPPQP